MAGVSDCFSIGSTVACKTCYNKEIEGEVLAFDPQTKMLILKCPSSSGRQPLHDVHIVNLSLVSDVQVKREVSPTSNEPPQSLNLQRLNTRVRNKVEEKKRMVNALQAGVSPEGRKLYFALSKTIQQIEWNGPDIVVWKEVTVKPPYTLDDVHGDADGSAYKHVKKLVDKFMKDSAISAASQQPQQSLQQQMQKGSSAQ